VAKRSVLIACTKEIRVVLKGMFWNHHCDG